MNPEMLLTDALRAAPWGETVSRVMAAALDAVDPARAVQQHLRRSGNTLHIGHRTIALDQVERVFVIGAGKAGVPMACATAEIIGERLSGGVVVTKEGHAENNILEGFAHLQLLEAGHPIPDERGVAGTQQIIELLRGTTERDLVIALISGGGSALLTRPVDGISLADIQSLTGALLRCGATINEINTLRKHLDTVKGGGLARLAHPAPLTALILSDVVGNPLDVIASGPSVPDTTSFADALEILDRYNVASDIPSSILTYLYQGAAGEIRETPKPGDPTFDHVTNIVIGSNGQAAQAALETARSAGMNTLLLTTFLQGEAREAGRLIGSIARELAISGNPIARPACIVIGGETTVTLRGNGRGGRNQELALAAVPEIAGLSNIALVTLATDGGDGPTDAAGAVVTGETFTRAAALGLASTTYLARNDSYAFFAPLGDLLRPGPTQTNVNDLAFIFAF
jgi:hydroxypyruvate reductase